jgi:hypothetical protein
MSRNEKGFEGRRVTGLSFKEVILNNKNQKEGVSRGGVEDEDNMLQVVVNALVLKELKAKFC